MLSRWVASRTPARKVLRVSVEEVLLTILTACVLPVRKSRIQLQTVVSRPRALSLVLRLEGTIVLNCSQWTAFPHRSRCIAAV